ncbi:MAG: hypothetical protein SH819_03810 [Cytophagales bacterium]|nr:hypothetical protein [Cytophagales bacterium]
MILTNALSSLSTQPIKVWVLAPHLESDDPNLEHYYDFSQSIREYETAFNGLGITWAWQQVTVKTFRSVIEAIDHERKVGTVTPVVFNLCDGDEVNGTPGISVVQLLDQKGLIYTGSDEFFYRITTSKIPMKRAFDKAGVPTAPWVPILSSDAALDTIFEKLGAPVILKPSVSAGSMGVGVKNVVSTPHDLREQVAKMFAGYRGWDLAADGLIAEAFVNGPEFTVLITGSYNNPRDAKIYDPVERVFHASLPDQEKFLSFDRLWEIYEDEKPMPDAGNFYEYGRPKAGLIEEIKKICWDAYVATRGCGYTRVDIRMDSKTGKLYVLEVNAQCGLSEDEDYTSIGAILRFCGTSFAEMVSEIIRDAFARRASVKIKKAL